MEGDGEERGACKFCCTNQPLHEMPGVLSLSRKGAMIIAKKPGLAFPGPLKDYLAGNLETDMVLLFQD